MMRRLCCFMLMVIFFNGVVIAHSSGGPAITQTISESELVSYSSNSAKVKKLISEALSLAGKNLTYLYGSANPKNGGMDCSGTINYLLTHTLFHDVPRQANEMYVWVDSEAKLFRVKKSSDDFNHLKPGDLLFWSGTYATHRSPPITHVMLYLGRDKRGMPLMFGSSDGRTFHGRRMRGVSVFDFVLPREGSAAKFVAYGPVPGYNSDNA